MVCEDLFINKEMFKQIPTIDAYLTYVHYVDESTIKLGYLYIDFDGKTTFDVKNFENCPSTIRMIESDLVETYKHILEINDERAYNYIKERSYELYKGKMQTLKYLLGSLALLSGPILASYSAFHISEDKTLFGGLLITGIILTGLDGYLFSHMLHSISFNKYDEEELNQYIEVEAKSRIRHKKGDENEKKNTN